VADTIDLTSEYLRRLDGKLDDMRADLDEVRAAMRNLKDRQLGWSGRSVSCASTWPGGTAGAMRSRLGWNGSNGG
jgi:hypothetical protein